PWLLEAWRGPARRTRCRTRLDSAIESSDTAEKRTSVLFSRIFHRRRLLGLGTATRGTRAAPPTRRADGRRGEAQAPSRQRPAAGARADRKAARSGKLPRAGQVRGHRHV